MPCHRWEGDTLVLELHLQPGARRSELAGRHGDRLRVRIGAPAREGRANRELVRLLAAELGVRRRDVRIVRGEGSRDKTVAVDAPRRLPEGIGKP